MRASYLSGCKMIICFVSPFPTKKVTGGCSPVQDPSNDAQQMLSESGSGMSDSGLGWHGLGHPLPRDRHTQGNKPVNKESCASHARRQDGCCNHLITVVVLWNYVSAAHICNVNCLSVLQD